MAVPTDGTAADLAIALDPETWVALASGKLALSDAVESGAVSTDHPDDVKGFFGNFDHASLAS